MSHLVHEVRSRVHEIRDVWVKTKDAAKCRALEETTYQYVLKTVSERRPRSYAEAALLCEEALKTTEIEFPRWSNP